MCYFTFVVQRYVYITFLRDPVNRYLSEFKHVQRGATWSTARLKCNGISAAGTIVPRCYPGKLRSFPDFLQAYVYFRPWHLQSVAILRQFFYTVV